MTGAAVVPDVEGLSNRMYALYACNQRSLGRFDPVSSKMYTEYRAAQVEDFRAHIAGKSGLGAVPIQDSNKCVWAAIDIDCHGQEEDIPIAPIDRKIRELKLPLVACRSKSGGVHAYLFLSEPVNAARLKGFLTRWAVQLGYPGAEIFPKQDKLLLDKSKKLQLGNWINLPYLNADKTVRYAFHNGKKLTLAEFVELAEAKRAAEKDLVGTALGDHSDAPPCVQRMMSEGVASGYRNEALFNITVYYRKKSPETAEASAVEANASIFAKPLGRAEMSRTISSAQRPDYAYRCGEEPLRSLCNRPVCVTLAYGVGAGADGADVAQHLPPFSSLIKYMSEPMRWEMTVGTVRITNISTDVLMEWRHIRVLIAERLTRVVPMIKNTEWERILQPLMETAQIVDTPDDASVPGVIRDRLREFAAKTDMMNRGESMDDRGALLRGVPVVQVMEGIRQVVFRAQDFINYLKRTRTEDLKGVNLWFAVKDIGVQHSRIRVGKHHVNVWHIPVTAVQVDAPEAPEFKSEL